MNVLGFSARLSVNQGGLSVSNLKIVINFREAILLSRANGVLRVKWEYNHEPSDEFEMRQRLGEQQS